MVASRCRELSALCHGLEIVLREPRPEFLRKEMFVFPNGLADLIRDINSDKTPVHPNLVHFRENEDGRDLEIAMQWTTAVDENCLNYACTYFTKMGTHRDGFQKSLTAVLTEFSHNIGPHRKSNLEPEKMRRGLTSLVSVKLPDPIFESAAR